MKYCSLFFLAVSVAMLNAQEADNSVLFNTLKTQDSLLFDVGFNTCDIRIFERLVSEDFEFYHDQSGITDSKETFITGTREGLCKMDYKARRELVEGSLQVFPLKNNGTLYGAIQMGEHRFYALYPDKEPLLTSIAKFTHLWRLEDGEWHLSRVLSYDHHSPEE